MKSDVQLQQDVLAELAWEPSVNAGSIGVEVSDGIVTLAGHVDSFSAKWEAQEAAQRVAGVKALAVEIDVTLPGASRRNDADIARAAQNVLEWSSYWPQDQIKVMVEGGWITLSGDLEWEYQRNAAAAAVRPLMGVVGVVDQIVVKSGVTALPDRKAIEAALHRRFHADADQIVVGVNGPNVTLTGTVHSWAQRRSACDAAWNTRGVVQVRDTLRIVPVAIRSRGAGDTLHLDGEDDLLYQDGLEVGDGSLTYAGTDGDRHKGVPG
jgi:osmotically-inducible protein OsmY